MEEIRDTSIIQLQSVKNFLSELGYQYMAPTKCFGSGYYSNRGREYISLNTAIKLHNGSLMDWHGDRFRYPFDDTPYEWFHAAHKAKIVHVAKLQHSKKKGIIVLDHRVRFVHEENAALLLKL